MNRANTQKDAKLNSLDLLMSKTNLQFFQQHRYHEHEVEEDHPTCKEEFEEKCQQVTQGYTTNEECTKWPITKCTLEKKTVKKYTPETNCKKVPFELCGPSGCPVEPGAEQCFDKSETVSASFNLTKLLLFEFYFI